MAGLPALVALLLVFGCSREAEFDAGTALGGLKAGDAVVEVDGAALTKAALHARVETMEALRLHRTPDAAVTNLQIATRRKLALCRAYVPIFIDQTLLENWARRERVEVSPSLMTNYMRRAFRNLRTKTDTSFRDLAALPGVDARELEAQVRGEALREAVTDALVARTPTNVPPEAVQRELAEMRDYNAIMTKTNVLIYARATNVWNQLRAGADFAALVRRYTEVPDEVEENGAWGVVDAQFLRDDRLLLSALEALKPGEFTPPVEGDNGLMIARLNAREDDGSFDVSRIFFRLPLFIEYPTPDELVATAKRDHAKNVFVALLRRLRAQAKIAYPHGTNLFTHTTSSATRKPTSSKEKTAQ